MFDIIQCLFLDDPGPAAFMFICFFVCMVIAVLYEEFK